MRFPIITIVFLPFSSLAEGFVLRLAMGILFFDAGF
jgi:hypothetical protein